MQTVVIPGAGHWVAEQAPDVVRGGLHPMPGRFTPAFRSADRQDGHR